jgi:LmbE family N-acetylglucosaminyl deacetylase
VVVAHPDDAELSMGMRLRWYADGGAAVHVHCLSKGASDPGAAARREAEAAEAGAILGISRYSFSDIPDTRFTAHRSEINGALFEVFAGDRPDIVYTHFPRDQHLDHMVAAQETTAVALREAANLCYFRSLYSESFEPDLFFIAGLELFEAKMAALHCFGSQGQLDLDAVRELSGVAHRQFLHHRVVERLGPGLSFAETFRVRRKIESSRDQPWQHAGTD